MVRLRVRGAALGCALGLTLASTAHARLPTTPPCNVWVEEPSITPFLDGVPLEGKVILPFKLVPGAALNEPGSLGTPAILVQVYDADGQSMPGYVTTFAGLVGTGETGEFAEWISSRALVAGARYRVEIDAQNSPACEPYAHPMATYDFVVADEPLPERVKDAVPMVESVTLDWVRTPTQASCCQASDTSRCTDKAQCFACWVSAVSLEVVVPVPPASQSAYLVTELVVNANPAPPNALSIVARAGATEVRSEQWLCAPEYCASWRVSSPLTDASFESEPRCVPGAEPTIEPLDNGAVMATSGPCADGQHTETSPSYCPFYPEVRWFEDVLDGYMALGLTREAAEYAARVNGTGAVGGTGGSASPAQGGSGNVTQSGTGGTAPASADGGTTTQTHSAPHCALPARGSANGNGARWLVLGAALLVLRQRRRGRALRHVRPACPPSPPRPPCPPSSPSPPTPDAEPAMPLPA